MIFAPKRGPDARRRIAYQIQRFANDAGDLVRRYTGSSSISEARKNRDQMVADAQAQADHIRDDIDALLEELRKQSSASRSS
jgi:Sec-independent protein translocase protein TatA